MSKRLLVLATSLLFLAGCNRTIASSPPPDTPIVSPTSSPLPTITEVPTSTPYPALQTQGPHLITTRDNKLITIFDADGSGRKQIQLPNDGYTFLRNAISPNGQWLVYFSGATKAPYNVTLNLLNLIDGTTQQISTLLAAGFPENLEPMVQSMQLGDPPIYDKDCFEDLECRRSLIQREVTDSILAFDWSPDGESIAFAAQRESPSTNIYIYQISDNTIRPLTKEPENIHLLEWAPNGASILYKISAAPGLGFEGSQWRLMDRNGTPIPFSSALSSELSRWDGDSWLTENLYLMLQFTDVDPAFSRFILLNTDTGQVKEIWPDHAYSYAVDHENKMLVLIHKDYRSQPSQTPEGVYIVYADGTNQKPSDVGYYLLVIESQKPYPILIEDYDRGFHSINDDGSITPLPWSSVPRISPDGSLFLTNVERELTLYDSSHQVLKSWTLKDRVSISWSRDSRGVFLFDSVNVYYLSITGNEPKPLFEDCALKYCPPAQYVWTP